MDKRLREAFDRIHAEEALKEHTKAFLARKTRGYRQPALSAFPGLLPAAVCLILLLAGWNGGRVYMTPASFISIDVNPSLELGINRFDRVVSVKGYNEDGNRLAASLDIRFMEYTKALEQVMASESVRSCLSRNEVLSIAVVGADQGRCRQMLSSIRSRTAGQRNTYCCMASFEDVTGAHKEGLSYGKYRAFLELQKLEPGITPEEIRGMSMREIRERIEYLAPGSVWADPDGEPADSGFCGQGECPGMGHGHGRQGRGRSESRRTVPRFPPATVQGVSELLPPPAW